MDNNTEMTTTEELDFEILEVSEATALEEMGASSTIGSGSSCKPN